MPIVQITLIEGRSDEAKERLHEKVAAAIQEAIGAPPESIKIMIYDVPKIDFSSGGVSKAKASGG